MVTREEAVEAQKLIMLIGSIIKSEEREPNEREMMGLEKAAEILAAYSNQPKEE